MARQTREVACLWDQASVYGAYSLTDAELADLHDWNCEREVCLPPAQWVADEMADRGLVDVDGNVIA